MVKLEMSKRDIEVEIVRADGNVEPEVVVSISSETPYKREIYDAIKGAWITAWEVLGHKENEVSFERMKHGLVIQDGHRGDQIGLIRTPKIEDGRIRGVIEFCSGQRAQDIRKDAIAGLRTNMSVGYYVERYAEQSEKLDGLPVYRAVRWTPYEGSFVNIPADSSVGVGRECGTQTADAPANPKNKGIKIMDEEKKELTAAQVVECFRIAKVAGVDNAEIGEMIRSKSFDEIREDLLGRAEKAMVAKPAMPAKTPEKAIAFAENEKREIGKRYSVINVIRALAGEAVDIGYEREVSDEIAHRSGKAAQGIYLPEFVRAGEFGVGLPSSSSNGAGLAEEKLLLGDLIGALRAKLVLDRAGMRVLSGMVGEVAIPKVSDAQAAWISAEGGNATKTNPTVGQVIATPHTAGGYVDITRRLMAQTSADVTGLVIDSLTASIARLLEAAAFNGSGSSGQPTGLVGQIPSGNQVTFTAGSPTLANLMAMIAAPENANADTSNAKFIGSPAVWSLLGQTYDYTLIESEGAPVGGITSGRYLLDAIANKAVGYDFIKSTLAPTKSLLFGDFSQLMMVLWSGVDLVVDPYSVSTVGGVRIVALQDCDFIVRHAEAFSLGKTVIA